MSWFQDWFSSPYYYKLYSNRNEQEAKVFLDALVKELRLPKGTRILDIACGKGRHSHTLANRGFNVLGIDLSQNSIDEASKKARTGLQFRVHDMRDLLPFEYNGWFGCAVNLFTSFGYFDDDEDNAKVMKMVRQALAPDGLFVLDFLNTSRTVKKLVQEEIKSTNGIFFFIDREYDGRWIHKKITFDADGKSHEYTEKVRALFFRDFQKLFADAGLEMVHTFGDYDMSDYFEAESNRMIMVVKKKTIQKPQAVESANDVTE
jgi:cyclopropane fatty-acyl-phospholipid synthase-like methyltransferase